MTHNGFSKKIDDLILELKTSRNGLSSIESQKRLKRFGSNSIVAKNKYKLIKELVAQFLDPLALILIVAGLLSIVFSETRDAVIIFIIVVLNAAIGFFQEYKAEKAMQALKKLVPLEATVLRDGDEKKIPVSEIVTGDIVILDEGDSVPADIRLLEANNFWTSDTVITGESELQLKIASDEGKKHFELASVDNMVFMGMNVAKGNAIGLVVATGMNTEFGRIAHLTANTKETKSPLQKEVGVMADVLMKVSLLVIVFIFIIGLILEKTPFESFGFSLGVAAALVPEGLAATISIALAVGVTRMVKNNTIIKRLSAVETLGCTSVIVTDKTGTLTKNEMTVKEIFTNKKTIHVEGVGNNSVGNFVYEGNIYDTKRLELFLQIGSICNDSSYQIKKNNSIEIIGDQTEGALMIMALKAGLDPESVKKNIVRHFEIPFDSERKMMSMVVLNNNKAKVYTKGATGEILNKCSHIYSEGLIRKITEEDKKEIIWHNDEFANSALRVLAFAYKDIGKKEKYANEEVESELVFVGLAGMIDPPKSEVKEAVSLCKKAGIRIIMVTGDHQLTAIAIGRRIGLFGSNEIPRTITGRELNILSDKELGEIILAGEVLFARVDPSHKIRIVRELQKAGEVVAVTGDGVNDAPALKGADVGVAMGIAGTDVSKESAEMIITDDNFSSIVKAVREGRIVYKNIKKFILYILSSNATEFFSVLFGLIIGVMPIIPIQILFIDLGTDVLPSMALAVDDGDNDIMSQKPRNAKEKLLNKNVISYLLQVGILGALLGLINFFIIMTQNGGISETSLYYSRATTVVYSTLVICQIVNSFMCRNNNGNFYEIVFGNRKLLISVMISIILLFNVVYNPFFQNIFSTSDLLLSDWALVMFSGIIFLFFLLIRLKYFLNRSMVFKKI